MKAFAYVYSRTRNKNHDYRMLSDISNTVCPLETKNILERRVSRFLSQNDGLETPQWMLIKESGYVLWGVACMNEMLNEAYAYDEYPRPLRGFTGILIPSYKEEPLPYDMGTFKSFFEKVMATVFDSYIQKSLTDIMVDTDNVAKYIYPRPFDDNLNTDYHYCRLFGPNADAELLVASCLSYSGDISIAINVAKTETVTDANYNPLFNAVMRDDSYVGKIDVEVMHKCGECGKKVFDIKDGLCQDCWDKLNKKPDDEQGDNNNNGEEEIIPPEPIICPQCGQEVECLSSSSGICEDCEKKKRKQMLIYCGILFVLLLFLSLWYYNEHIGFSQKSEPGIEIKTNERQSQPVNNNYMMKTSVVNITDSLTDK